MSSASPSPPTEQGSGFSPTLTSNSAAGHVPVEMPEAPASLDDLLKSRQNPALQAHPSSSTLQGASADDQRRRNGFHLWRTESEDARKARLRRAMQAAEAQVNAPRSISDRVRNKLAGIASRLSSSRFLSLYRRSSISLPEEEDGVATQLFLLREQKLTTLGLMILTLSLAGAQLAWTLELAYGTPYLLSLGLSEQSTSLVWLAGPLSGLIAQPVVGSLSDHSTSAFRRRKYMIISATLLTISTITLAYSVPISTALVDLFGGGLADWDPQRHRLVHSTTQAISVIAFWILDFALNGLQAASRALILDTAPSEQQSIANAWQGRMTHAGNVLGYLCGWLDLASWKGLRWLGGGQFRRFAMISLLAMISCVSVTVTCISESTTEHNFAHHDHRRSPCTSTLRKIETTFNDVWHAIRRLPRSVRRVCLVQLFAFMGWFPFLFYSTTYILQIAQYERNLERQQKHHAFALGRSPYYQDEPRAVDGSDDTDRSRGRPSSDRDAERGSFAMLLFAIVSLLAGALLPYLALAGEKRDKESPSQDSPDEEPSTPPLRLDIPTEEDLLPNHDPEYNEKISRAGRIARGLTKGLTLRTFWTLASIIFATLMLIGTAWASTVNQATIVIALVGVPWSIAAWAPFAMVGEFVREAEDGASPFEFEDDHWSPSRTRARANLRWLKKQRRESLRQSVSRVDDDVGAAANGMLTSPNGSGSGPDARAGFKYIDPDTSPTRRQSQLFSSSEQGARERVRRSLVDCGHLPRTLTVDQSNDDDGEEEPQGDGYRYGGSDDGDEHRHDGGGGTGTGGAGTILGIHNLAIVVPQFVVAIIASLIFSAIHSSHSGIHLVLGQQPFALGALADRTPPAVSNPAEGTVWVLRFGGSMAILAALATRFVPLTLSERQRRYASHQQRRHPSDPDEQDVAIGSE